MSTVIIWAKAFPHGCKKMSLCTQEGSDAPEEQPLPTVDILHLQAILTPPGGAWLPLRKRRRLVWQG